MKNFDLYSQENIHFIEKDMPHLLRDAVDDTRPGILLDIGCGDGREIVPLTHYRETVVIGMDLSHLRLRRVRNGCPKVSLIQADANKVLPFKLGKIDFMVCSQLIEHLKDDRFFLEQLYIILSKKAILFLSTVYKKKWSWWIYKANGKRVCDPTHLYEYEGQHDVLGRIKGAGFTIQRVRSISFCVSVVRNLMRMMTTHGVLSDTQARRIMAHPFFQTLAEYIICPVPGYRIIEVICQKT